LSLSAGALSRYENGHRLASPEVVTRLLDYYAGRGLVTTEKTRETLMNLARGTESSPWVALSLPEQQRQLSTMPRFEQTASRITNLAQFLPDVGGGGVVCAALAARRRPTGSSRPGGDDLPVHPVAFVLA
jgi:hypothetical protein